MTVPRDSLSDLIEDKKPPSTESRSVKGLSRAVEADWFRAAGSPTAVGKLCVLGIRLADLMTAGPRFTTAKISGR